VVPPPATLGSQAVGVSARETKQTSMVLVVVLARLTWLALLGVARIAVTDIERRAPAQRCVVSSGTGGAAAAVV
jgi:hypothetical protein